MECYVGIWALHEVYVVNPGIFEGSQHIPIRPDQPTGLANPVGQPSRPTRPAKWLAKCPATHGRPLARHPPSCPPIGWPVGRPVLAGQYWLATIGFDPVYGARPLKRAIQRELETPIAKAILAGQLSEGQTVQVDATDEKLSIS